MLSPEIVAPSPRCDSASVNPAIHPTVTSLHDAESGADAARPPPGWCRVNSVARASLLTLRADAPIVEALELASAMMASALQTTRQIAMDQCSEQIVCLWSSVYLLDTVASILDASILAINDDQAGGPNWSDADAKAARA